MSILISESPTVHQNSNVVLFTGNPIHQVLTVLISYPGVTILPLARGLLGFPVVRVITDMVVTRSDHHLGRLERHVTKPQLPDDTFVVTIVS